MVSTKNVRGGGGVDGEKKIVIILKKEIATKTPKIISLKQKFLWLMQEVSIFFSKILLQNFYGGDVREDLVYSLR